MSDETRLLILCTGNSARSQMAEGLLRHDHGKHVEEFGAQQFDYVITVCDNARKLARCTLARRKNCITISRTLRPLPAPKNKGSLCSGVCETNCAATCERSL